MKPTIKTDKCIGLLKEVQIGIAPFLFKIKRNDELRHILKNAPKTGEAARKYFNDKSGKELFKTDEDALNAIFNKELLLRRLTRSKALLSYVVCPMSVFKGDFTDREKTLAFMHKYNLWTGEPYFDVVLDALRIETITPKDLEYEFMELCPDVDSIPKYLPITRMKFKDVLSNLPDRDYYSPNNLLFNLNSNEYSNNIRLLEEIGILTNKEADEVLVSVSEIIDGIHQVVDQIAIIYNNFKRMRSQRNNLSSSIDFKQEKMNTTEYFKIEAMDDPELEPLIPELLKVIEDLRLFRNSEPQTYDYINIWLKSKYESTRIVTLSNGEKVEADINNPDLTMYYRYNNWLLGYFQYEYEHKTQATISFAYALSILTQIHNGQRGVFTCELPNTDKDDIIAAITNENSLELAPQRHNSIINTSDIDIFKSYFVANKNDWWDRLVIDIKANLKSGKGGYTIVAMAKVIYDSGKLHESMKPKKFAPWLRVFCETWGIAEIPTCKAGHTGVKDEITRINNVFWYFNFTIPK